MGLKSRKKASEGSKPAPSPSSQKDNYSAFDQLDGSHPWTKAVPEGCLTYPVRELQRGKVAYFNFDLAKEMGLISQNHPRKMTVSLENKLLETFSLQIINEYDQTHNFQVDSQLIKKNEYMATRYLQLQHRNKTGATSGDGRSIWNGTVKHKGVEWDVSSRGTGVTALAPGTVEAGQPLKTGNTDFGYGCGLAEIDELYGSAIMAEAFYRNGIPTERVLTVIDLGKGLGIGVRAGKNLFRPAHFFLFLKQKKLSALKRSVDFFIQRQYENGESSIKPRSPSRYDQLLVQVCDDFASFTAQIEREYIFAWLDWDGDNILATAGIIDYGSVRQFGLRHDKYRYDDVERYSTNLTEQRAKARLIVQVFCQLVDYLKTGEKKPLQEFANHSVLIDFDKSFDEYKFDYFLYQLGYLEKQREFLLTKKRPLIESLYSDFHFLERLKTSKKEEKVADGVNHPAILNMRTLMRELAFKVSPESSKGEMANVTPELFQDILADHASRTDAKLTPAIEKRLNLVQETYCQILKETTPLLAWDDLTSQLKERSAVINRPDRITGNALLNIVNELVKEKKRGLSYADIQALIDTVIEKQVLKPGANESRPRRVRSPKALRVKNRVLSLVEEYKEDI